MNKIACTYMRGGTSKGPFMDLRDLPENSDERDAILLRLMGSPDIKQIDGIGGASFVTSKLVMVRPSHRAGIDVDYLFAQIIIDKHVVDTNPTCGNMMSGVAPFAIEKGWINIKPGDTEVKVMVFNMNTDSTIEVYVQLEDGHVNYQNGELHIDGVPGKASPILMKMFDVEGGTTGKLFPSRNKIDLIQEKEVTIIDSGNMMIHMRASDFGLNRK